MRGGGHRGWVGGGAAWLVPMVAYAGNGGHPRTPVDWPDDVACMTVVDRSQSVVLQFAYAIPYEDVDLTPDELPDSRRHQFVAFCDDRGAGVTRPNWLSWADVDAWRAWAEVHMLDAAPVYAGDVVETSDLYKDTNCVFRITGDDARRPITDEAASADVAWDTTEVPAGAYIVEGYTWEPEANKWSKRPGVVHVVDGADLAAVGPALALYGEGEGFVEAGGTYVLGGCARAMAGSTLRGYWSLPDPLDWQLFAADVAVAGEAIAVPFTPPPLVYGETVALRVEVVDPLQRRFSAYPAALLSVLAPAAATTTTTGCDGTCGDSGTSTGSDGDSEGATSSGASTTMAVVAEAEAEGCGCASASAPGWGLMALVGLLRRRRRTM